MTIEEAIKWMQEEKASFDRAPDLNGCPMTEYWQKAIDAIDMAIYALRAQQDVTDKDVGKMTNAQKIRSMSDEELVEFIKNIKVRAAFCKTLKDNDAFEALCSAEWLQMPEEEDDHETS